MVLADSIGHKKFASSLNHKTKKMNTTIFSFKGMFVLALVATFALTSCNRDTEGCTDPAAENYDADADTDDGTCSYAVVAPDTYVFTDADGNNTVSYSGQHQRLNMLSEMSSYLKTANDEGVAVDADVLKNMYGNENHTWDDEEGLGMTGSSKQLKNKTVGGDTEFTNVFETWMDEVAAASDGSGAGSAGAAGVVLSTTNPAKQYLQSAQGQEWTQLIEKGLMGACFYYNISVVYLGNDKMDVDNTTPEDPANGKYYTKMEHHWDEGYGYFTTAVDYPNSGTDRFWGKYANGREDLLQSASKISAAFRLGRAAISADNMTARDQQIDIIRTELELAAAGSAIHYFNSAIANFADDALRNHALSEAKAFMWGLQFGENTSVDSDEVAHLLEDLGDDFYSVTTATLTEVRDELAAATGLSDLADQL